MEVAERSVDSFQTRIKNSPDSPRYSLFDATFCFAVSFGKA
jgi:hypothetical protein